MKACYRSLFCPELDKIRCGNDQILSAGLATANWYWHSMLYVQWIIMTIIYVTDTK